LFLSLFICKIEKIMITIGLRKSTLLTWECQPWSWSLQPLTWACSGSYYLLSPSVWLRASSISLWFSQGLVPGVIFTSEVATQRWLQGMADLRWVVTSPSGHGGLDQNRKPLFLARLGCTLAG
jgi:hypothetical protein